MRCLWSRKLFDWLDATARVVRAAFSGVLRASDGGTVTAEFAIIFPTVIAVAVLVLGLTRVIIVQLGCQDAARQAAYAVRLAQLEGLSEVQSFEAGASAGKSVAGQEIRVDVDWAADSFTVRAACPVLSARGASLPLTVHAQARGIRYALSE